VRDEIVIVDPSSYRIVASLPYRAVRPLQRRLPASVVRSHSPTATAKPSAKTSVRCRWSIKTTGSAARTEIRTGEPVPEGVEIEAFPEEVYRDAPDLRE
jgi:hypothetical protein